MSQPSTSSDLEVLFIEKLQLKYQLNERDLKKAFSRYDKDNSGYLDIEEIGIAARLMLNGVSDEQVRNLVSRFDLNGDGTISYDEFLQYLLKRKDGPTTAAMDANDARSDRRNWNRNTMYKSQFDDYNDHSRSAARKTTEIERSTSNSQNEGYGRESSTGRRTHRQQSEGNTGRRNYQHNSGNTGGHSHQQEIDSNIGKVGYAQQNQGNRQQQERITGRRPNYQKSEGYTNRPGNKGQSNFEQNVPDDDDSQSFSLDDENNEEYDSDEGCDEFPSVNAELRGPIGDSSRQIYMKRGNPRDYDSQSTTSETPSDVASNFDPSNSSEVEYRCKAFLENLRSLLNKRVLSLRDKGALAHHLTLSNKELLEKTGCALLTKAFQNYTGGTRTRKEDQLIDLGDFIR